MSHLHRRTLLTAGALAAGATALPLVTGGPSLAVPHAATVLATGLKNPWSLTFLPNGDALTGEKHTRNVYRIFRTGGRRYVGTVGGGATKLMAIALSPSYATNGLLYAHVLTATGSRVVSMTYRNGALGTPRVVFGGIPVSTDHSGGGLLFSPDGAYLYVSLGDLGSKDQARVNTSLAGKILRLRADGTIPTDNPWGTRNPAWSKGHRNVEGMSFDSGGRLWAVEFGEDTTDELNQIVRGGDYGWPTYEGGDGAGPVRDPFVTWSPTSVCSPAGLAIKGSYAYVGALAGECVYRVKLQGPGQREVLQFFHHTYRRIRWIQPAPDGSLWMTTGNNEFDKPRAPTDDRVIRFLP